MPQQEIHGDKHRKIIYQGVLKISTMMMDASNLTLNNKNAMYRSGISAF